jgi:hypothetical protein
MCCLPSERSACASCRIGNLIQQFAPMLNPWFRKGTDRTATRQTNSVTTSDVYARNEEAAVYGKALAGDKARPITSEENR